MYTVNAGKPILAQFSNQITVTATGVYNLDWSTAIQAINGVRNISVVITQWSSFPEVVALAVANQGWLMRLDMIGGFAPDNKPGGGAIVASGAVNASGQNQHYMPMWSRSVLFTDPTTAIPGIQFTAAGLAGATSRIYTTVSGVIIQGS